MRHLILLSYLFEQGNLITLINYYQNLKEIIQSKAVILFIGLIKYMKPTSSKMVSKSPSIQPALHYVWIITLFWFNFPFSFILKSYPTLFNIPSSNYCVILLNSAMIFPKDSSAVLSWDALIASNVFKIVTWGGFPVKVGVLSVFPQGNVFVESLIK